MIIFGTGIVRSFTGPTFNVILAQVVPKPILQNAITWNQGAWLSASVCGHAAGGFLIGGLGQFRNAGCYLFTDGDRFYGIVPLKPKPALNEKKETGTWDSVLEGLRFVLKQKNCSAPSRLTFLPYCLVARLRWFRFMPGTY